MAQPQFADRRSRVTQQPAAEILVRPGAGHDTGALGRRLLLPLLDLAANLAGADYALLDQQLGDGDLQKLVLLRHVVAVLDRRVVVIMVMVMVMVVVAMAGHADVSSTRSSQWA